MKIKSSLLSEKTFRIGNTGDEDGEVSGNNASLVVLISSRVRYSSVRPSMKPRVWESIATWWRPILVWEGAKIPVFFIIAGVVVTLQVLLKLFNDNNRIVDFNSKQSVKLPLTILLALCMIDNPLCIGTLAKSPRQ